MIADTTFAQATSRTDRPRAFEPSQAAALPTPAREPGWDLGPERRIDDGHALARLLVYAGTFSGAHPDSMASSDCVDGDRASDRRPFVHVHVHVLVPGG